MSSASCTYNGGVTPRDVRLRRTLPRITRALLSSQSPRPHFLPFFFPPFRTRGGPRLVAAARITPTSRPGTRGYRKSSRQMPTGRPFFDFAPFAIRGVRNRR